MHFNYKAYWKCSLRWEEKEAQVPFVEMCLKTKYIGSNNQLMKKEENEKKIFHLKGDSWSQEALANVPAMNWFWSSSQEKFLLFVQFLLPKAHFMWKVVFGLKQWRKILIPPLLNVEKIWSALTLDWFCHWRQGKPIQDICILLNLWFSYLPNLSHIFGSRIIEVRTVGL